LLSAIGRNVVVILSTHIVDDVRELCSRMAIISSGQLILQGAPAEAIAALNGRVYSKVVPTDEEREAIEKAFPVISTHRVGGLNEVRVYSETPLADGFVSGEADLEDVYFHELGQHRPN
jgi:ABC-2 type transport system ATP-binding protein